MPAPITEAICDFEFVVGEKSDIQVEFITLASGQNLLAGAILAKTFVGTGAGANAAGNTGNPTIGAVTVGSKAQAGEYLCRMYDATHFQVFGPDGVYLGAGVMGTPFVSVDRVTFTITAGVTPAVAGDTVVIFVTEGATTYKAATGSDAVAILGVTTDASAGAVNTVAVVRLSQFFVNKANYGAMDAAHKVAANAALARRNIVARSGF